MFKSFEEWADPVNGQMTQALFVFDIFICFYILYNV